MADKKESTGDTLGKLGGTLGALSWFANSVVSLNSKNSDKEKGLSTAITGLGTTGAGVLGLISGISDVNSKKEGESKFDGGLKATVGGIDTTRGIVDMVAGGLDATEHKKGAGIAGAISGVLSGLSGIGGIWSGGKGAIEAISAYRKDKDNKDRKMDKSKLVGGILGALSGLAGLAGGITATVSGVQRAGGNDSSAMDKTTGILGMLGGLVGSFAPVV